MSDAEQAEYAELPEALTVYRGVANNIFAKSRVRGFSWTLDESVAAGFASFYETNPGVVYAATVHRRDVIAYWSAGLEGDRSEREVLLHPDAARRLRPHKLTDPLGVLEDN